MKRLLILALLFCGVAQAQTRSALGTPTQMQWARGALASDSGLFTPSLDTTAVNRLRSYYQGAGIYVPLAWQNGELYRYLGGSWAKAVQTSSSIPDTNVLATKSYVNNGLSSAAAATSTALAGKASLSHSHSGADITSGSIPSGRYGSGTIPLQSLNASGYTGSGTRALKDDGTWGVLSNNSFAYGTSLPQDRGIMGVLDTTNPPKLLIRGANGVGYYVAFADSVLPPATVGPVVLSGNSTLAAYLGQTAVSAYYFTSANLAAGYSVINIAEPGARISTTSNNQQDNWDTVTNKAQKIAVIVEIGLNDVDSTVSTTAQTIAQYQAYINDIRATSSPATKILVATMTPAKSRNVTFYGTAGQNKWVAINQAVAGLGPTPITGVDGRITGHTAALSDGADNLAPQFEIPGTNDGVHENNYGRRIIAFWHTRGMHDAGVFDDNVSPTLLYASVTTTNTIQLAFSEGVSASVAGYSFTLNGSPLGITSITGGQGGDTITFLTSVLMEDGDTLRVSYNPASGNTLDNVYNELGAVTNYSIVNTLVGVGGLIALDFPTQTGLTNNAGVWQSGGGSFTSYGLASQKLPAGVDGYIRFQYAATDGQLAIIGFNTSNINEPYQGYEAGVVTGGDGNAYIIENGNVGGSVGTSVLSHYYVVERAGSTFRLYHNASGTPTGTPVYTYIPTSSADLFININVNGTNKIYYPQGFNVQ